MIQVRAATVKDAEAISGIVCRCYEGFEQTDEWPHDVVTELKAVRGSADCIRELIAGERVFVVDDDGSVRGMVSIRKNEVTKLFVDPTHHRQGIGRRLFSHAESFIRDQGHRHMFLGAAVRTPIAYYEKMGMKIARTRVIDHGPCVGMISTILEKSFGT
ncbi:MAG: GNAT family N-acetyltransferase [Planctomycetota bacterium]